MFKFILAVVAAVFLVAGGGQALAATTLDSGKVCSPTNIRYCPKEGGNSWLKGRYTTYKVRCSDGTQRTITHWQKNKQWCVNKTRNCGRGQLQAAKRACVQ